MTYKPNHRLEELMRKACPWSMYYAERSYFEAGYFAEEGRLVDKYLKRPSDILVLGSGNGREARPICRDGHRIICMDRGSLYLVSGQKLFASEEIQNVRFIQADVANLPFAGCCFDLVFFSLYSIHGERRFSIMNDIRRCLRKEGLVLLTVCTPLYGKLRPELDDWAWVSSVEQLCQEVSSCGFELLESAVDRPRPEYRFSMLRKQYTEDRRTTVG